MLKILINAYACSPGMGSEPGMAWNWVSNLAKFCELYIITEGEFRDKIEEVVPTLEQGKNIPPPPPNHTACDFANLKKKKKKDRSLLKLLSENCKERQMELSWEEKAKVMVVWYKKGKML